GRDGGAARLHQRAAGLHPRERGERPAGRRAGAPHRLREERADLSAAAGHGGQPGPAREAAPHAEGDRGGAAHRLWRDGVDARQDEPEGPLPPVERQLALLAGDRDGALNGENVVLGGTFPTFAPGDKRVGLVPLKVAQRLLRMEGRVTEYGIATDTLESADEV